MKKLCIGYAVKRLRIEKGLKQLQLAKNAGINQGYLSELENCKKYPGGLIIHKLARALDVKEQIIFDIAKNHESIDDDIKALLDSDSFSA